MAAARVTSQPLRQEQDRRVIGAGSAVRARSAPGVRVTARSASSSGSFADSLRPRPAISTTVTPSSPRTARTQTRRRWMNSEPTSPAMAAMAPASAQPLPGCWEIWKLAHSLISFSKVIEPAPSGQLHRLAGQQGLLEHARPWSP